MTDDDDGADSVSAEIAYWATAEMECWSCHRTARVTVLVAIPPVYCGSGSETEEEDEPMFVTGLRGLSEETLAELRSVNPDVWPDFSSTAGEEYLMNHCRHCEAKIGDHYITQATGPLLPADDEDLAKVQLTSMKEPLAAEATGFVMSSRLPEMLAYLQPTERGH